MNEASSDALKYSDFTLSKYGNKRIRINKPEDGTKYFVSRFSDNKELNKLTSPITFICKDEDTDNGSSLNKNNNNSTSWVLKNASIEKMRINHKSYVSKKCNLDTDVFFVLIENEEYSDIYPVSSWQVFEPNLSSKTLNKFNVDNSEEKLRTQMDNKRIDDIIERLKNKEEQNKLNIKAKEEKKKKKKKKNILPSDSSEDLDDDDDDLGLKRQEKRRIKNLIKLKRGENKEEIEYANSALSITSLRKSKVNWDYNNDGRKSDDEDLNEEVSGQEDFDNDNDDNDDSENNSDNDQYKLTSYGQAMRSLLKQQVNDEEDDELNQYSDDDDEEDEEDEDEEDEEDDDDDDEDDDEEDSDDDKPSNKKQLKNNKKIQNEREKDKYKLEKNKKNNNKHFYEEDEQEDQENSDDNKKNTHDDHNEMKKDTPKINQEKTQEELKRRLSTNDKFNKFNEYIKEKIKNKEIQIKEDNCAKLIVKIVEKNNGKMNIMTLLDTLNIREKNDNFLIVQKYIKNLCNISSETVNDKKIKTITIKPKYLQKK
ncbi:asparagine-rich antigen R13 [Plasmodium falciparum IGH-CR14]|uniref:Asparagine-rich antigen R13 n=3 Tax=Plasmodium falciparum TaxID=5833 RepID=A0A0L1I503_PLAFA|nr:asparagine-rich antigen R13 [Plasmodium falciparum IGH-CR14]